MSVFTTGELHEVADQVLQAIKTVPAADKFSESAGSWMDIDRLEKHIKNQRKETGLRIDNETFSLCIGLLVGRGEIECNRAHGRGVGYFFIIREAQEPTENEQKT